jgi:hypothetical protein
MSLMQEKVVLQLNAGWLPLCVKTPEQAFVDMAGGALLGMVIEDDKFYPVDWERWLTLAPLTAEFTAHTPRLSIRIPAVVIAPNFRRMPMVRPRLCRDNVFVRDHYTCGYSGRKLQPSEASVDHVLPVSRHGRTEWENIVTCHKEINSEKGGRTPAEAGLKLIFQPKQPLSVPASSTIRNPMGIREWDFFLG